MYVYVSLWKCCYIYLQVYSQRWRIQQKIQQMSRNLSVQIKNWMLHMSALYKMQMWLELFFIHFSLYVVVVVVFVALLYFSFNCAHAIIFFDGTSASRRITQYAPSIINASSPQSGSRYGIPLRNLWLWARAHNQSAVAQSVSVSGEDSVWVSVSVSDSDLDTMSVFQWLNYHA